MTPQELKNSILQLAIQGKLVDQRSEEGTAEELYQQIREEKQRLTKKGKIKKERPLPVITEEEKPSEIPESWKWIRLGELVRVIGGVSYKKTDVSQTGLRVLRGGNIQAMRVLINDDDVCLPFEYRDDEKQVQVGDIVIVASTGSKTVIGKAGYVDRELPDTMIGAFLRICRPVYMATVDYLHCIFDSKFYRKHIRDLSQGTNINNVKESYITEFIIPLPPLAEQKRIVAKIEELLPYIDRYEQAWTRLEELNKRFPSDLQKSILQWAIQGKLVEQREEEGTAEELYRRIQEEKERLVKEGTIKKAKSLPEITEDEVPFEVPGNWKWVRFSDLMDTMSTGPFGSILHKSDYIQNGIPLINPASIVHGKIIVAPEMTISVETAKRLEMYTLHQGMIVIGRRGEMGRCAVVTAHEDGWLCGTGSFFMKPNPGLYAYYISMFFSAPYAKAYLSGKSVGTTMSNLNHRILRKMPFSLPPLAEQKRIVSKLEELLPLCDRLK